MKEDISNKKLDEKFERAIVAAENIDDNLPPDVRLLFYAYYKRGIGAARWEKQQKYTSSDRKALVNAVKLNALIQVKRISRDEAKKRYIELVESYVTID